MNHLKRVLNKSLGAWLAFCIVLAPMPQVQAGPKAQEASERFERGVELYRAGDVQAANIEFKRAYAIDPNYRLLFNIAQASAELKDYVTAHRYFERYLEEGRGRVSRERKQLVEAEIARMRSYLGGVELQIEAADAAIFVDGVEKLPEEIEDGKLLLGAGRRTIAVTAPGYHRFETVIDVAGEDELELQVDLRKLAPSASAAKNTQDLGPTSSKSEKPKKGMGSLFWGAVGTTIGFGVVSVAAGILTNRTYRINRRLVGSVPTSQVEIDQSAKNLRGIALITDISLALTGTAAVVAIVSGIARVKRRKKSEAPKLSAGLHARGLSLQGRF